MKALTTLTTALTVALFAFVTFGLQAQITVGTPSTATPEVVESQVTDSPDGKNRLTIRYRSFLTIADGANVTFEGVEGGAAETFSAMQGSEIGRIALEGLAYNVANGNESRYTDLKGADRKILEQKMKRADSQVNALIAGFSTADYASQVLYGKAIDGFRRDANRWMAMLGETSIVQDDDDSESIFPASNNEYDLSDFIVFAGIIILLFLAAGKVTSAVKKWKKENDEKKERREKEKEEAREALREKRAREAGSSRNRSRSRSRSRNRGDATKTETPAPEATEE